MKIDERIIQIVIDPSDGQVIGLSQYGRVFRIRYGITGSGWILDTGAELYAKDGKELGYGKGVHK
mgnify:FL=1